MHSTGNVHATRGTKAAVPSETSTMSADSVTSAMLRPQGQRQQNGERCDRHQATHRSVL
jgi:hypothetical protein